MLSPTIIARNQTSYLIEKNKKMFVFDLARQRIYNYAFSYFNMRQFERSNFSTRENQEQGEIYMFYNDQVVLDSQLDDLVFEKPVMTISSFISDEENKIISKAIIRKNYWIKKFAEKLFLILFRADHLQPKPKFLFGFEIKDVRENKADFNKWY